MSAAIVAPTGFAEAASFPDVKSTDYFYEAVTSLTERGIIKGFPDGTFKPYQSVTRGQAAKILAGVLGLDTNNVKNLFKAVSFCLAESGTGTESAWHPFPVFAIISANYLEKNSK
ncbi:S-layer homology domain-containing protein [Ureibacillus suwonensis]|uniref:S-layer homology domain-containing protein n=1 Tax=Ureibacillus suwonensis TaxID=313007 RepID=A0ABW0RCQ7_9BACL